MGVAGEFGFEAAGRLAQGGALTHMAVQGAFDEIRVRRERAVDSVSELALRLQESRRAQHAAERRAAVVEQQLGGALSELRLLRDALRHEKAVTAALRAAVGV